MPQTLYDKLWDSHLVTTRDDGKDLIYIDRHILHEVTTPQAFAGLEKSQRLPWRITPNLATLDHSIPTTNHSDGIEKIADKFARLQVQTLEKNCKKYGITQYSLGDIEQGIVHVMAPEQGAILPGMTVVCGDSHTSTHGAFAAMAQGIGTSEVEHVLATQCLAQKKLANMQINFTGTLQAGVTAKDMILALIAKIGTAGGTGYAMEFTGEAIAQLSMEERMTICNMSIEAGSRVGLVAVDDTTVAYLKDKTFTPTGNQWESAVTYWQSLTSDKNAVFDKTIHIDVTNLSPQVTWGTSPQMTIGITDTIPSLDNSKLAQDDYASALNYMDVQQGKKITDYGVDVVFIGSCTNSRIEDLREAALIAKTGTVNPSTQALVVAGSGQVKRQAEQEGLDKIFIDAGFEWRDPGCSMCIAMNPDKLKAGQRSASTSNRNFIGRQGFGGRTHLVSPAMAAAAALAGKFVDVRKYY